jgi:hypothetical protein
MAFFIELQRTIILTESSNILSKLQLRSLAEIMKIPSIGKFIYFKDPDGNTMGTLEGGM